MPSGDFHFRRSVAKCVRLCDRNNHSRRTPSITPEHELKQSIVETHTEVNGMVNDMYVSVNYVNVCCCGSVRHQGVNIGFYLGQKPKGYFFGALVTNLNGISKYLSRRI